MKRAHKIVLIDDHPIVREGIKRMLSQDSDLRVCAELDNPQLALETIRINDPDMVLMELILKRGDGLDLIRQMRREYPHLPILIISQHDEMMYSERVLRAGAQGYVMKEETVDRILEAIRQVLQGQYFVSLRFSQKVLRTLAQGKKEGTSEGVEALSDRELQVFTMMGRGLRTRRIAANLSLSVKTVETYQSHIKVKLGLQSIEDIRKIAMQVEKTPALD